MPVSTVVMAELFREPVSTFLGAPHRKTAKGARAAVLGCPFDHGVAMRVGARLGPKAIRETSAGLGPYDPETGRNLVAGAGLVDLGDADVTPGAVDSSFGAIEAAAEHILAEGAVPLAMGGDGMVSLPLLRAAARRNPGLALIHIDAHSDTYPVAGYNTATTFSRAAEEELLDTARSFHIGLRGTAIHPQAWVHPRSLGFNLVPMAELRAAGAPAIAETVRGAVGDAPVYLCFDMDFFDASIAPGVCNPVYGGATVAEAFDLIEALAGLDIVAFDVNTVSPPHDVQNMTALLAATVMLSFVRQIADHG